MLTRNKHHELVMHAGPSFLWTNGTKMGTRGKSNQRKGLRLFLMDYCDGLCVFCGVRPARELCHVVAAGPHSDDNGNRIRRGYVPGNIGPGCVECNEEQAARGPIVDYEAIARPDLIPEVWPNETTLRAMGDAAQAAQSA